MGEAEGLVENHQGYPTGIQGPTVNVGERLSPFRLPYKVAQTGDLNNRDLLLTVQEAVSTSKACFLLRPHLGAYRVLPSDHMPRGPLPRGFTGTERGQAL